MNTFSALKAGLMSSATLVAVAGGAHAADAIDTRYDWSGVYAGIVAGGGMYSQVSPGYYFGDYYTVNRSDWGALAGGTLGVNFQYDRLVFGVEGDLSWSNLGVDEKINGDADNYATEGGWDALGTLRVRTGLAFDRTLFFATAGLAFANVDQSFCYEAGCGSDDGYYDIHHEGWKTGLAAGFGVEQAIGDNMTAKLEYLYIGLPDDGASGDYIKDNDYSEVNVNSSANLVRLGLNYKFGGMAGLSATSDAIDSGYDWSGIYVGIVAGGGMYSQVTPGYYYGGDYWAVDRSGWGVLAGGTLGVNFQHDNLVFGVEGDLSWSNLGVDQKEANDDPGRDLTEGSWTALGTLRARAGLASDRTLVYATAGLAFANVDQSYCYEDGCGSYQDGYRDVKHEGWHTGFTAGVGAEQAFSEHMTAKLEYLYVGLPEVAGEDSDYTKDNDYTEMHFSSSAHIVRLGLNYKFAGMTASASEAGDAGYDWTGFYAGIVGGGGVYSQVTPGYYYNDYYGVKRSGFGALAGATLGANYQHDNLVFGVEGDLSWSNLGVDQQEAGYDPDNYETEGSWSGLGTLRARAGLAVDRTLMFATAGLAFANVDQSFCDEAGCGSDDGYYDIHNEGWQTGFTAGVGVERAFGEHMTAKLEYLYVGLPDATEYSDYAKNNDDADMTFSSSANIARLGLNYKF